MIVDTSAILAVLLGEEEAKDFKKILATTDSISMSVASYLEASLRIDWERDPIMSRLLDELLELFEVDIVPVTLDQGKVARDANKDFGKGSGHAAKLNFGDCFSYALAKERGEPLLFKGKDFSETDIVSAL